MPLVIVSSDLLFCPFLFAPTDRAHLCPRCQCWNGGGWGQWNWQNICRPGLKRAQQTSITCTQRSKRAVENVKRAPRKSLFFWRMYLQPSFQQLSGRTVGGGLSFAPWGGWGSSFETVSWARWCFWRYPLVMVSAPKMCRKYLETCIEIRKRAYIFWKRASVKSNIQIPSQGSPFGG